MSIKQKLEWGIFPIASRRHQPRDSGYRYAPHDLTHDDSVSIIVAIVATPFVAAILSSFHGGNNMDFGGWLLFLIFLDIYLIWNIRHS